MTIRPNSMQARDIANLLHPFTDLSVHQKEGPLVIAKGDGIYVIDDGVYVAACSCRRLQVHQV